MYEQIRNTFLNGLNDFYAKDIANGVVNGAFLYGAALHQFFQVREEAEGHHIHIRLFLKNMPPILCFFEKQT